ncbi:hypothetical protein CJ030_MR4G018388 [Morella rubra]|uniref:Pentatricopeptide repeat-containing protein n=1 Tax=Morella rubra TaxID=262757 RepID=A0A6A1VUU4_9ROSI|nr:hypothetical protein CJ030_MR4G018388 [Morella rubra]
MAATLACAYFYDSNAAGMVSRKQVETMKTVRKSGLVKHQKFCRSASLTRNRSNDEKGLVEPRTGSPTEALCNFVDSGCMGDALYLFEKINHFDSYIWNVMIRGLTNNGFFTEAIQFYGRMEYEGVRADNFTYPFVIKACTGLLSLTEGQKVHGKLVKIGLDLDVYVCNSLTVMYAKVQCIEFAERIFGEMTAQGMKPDRFSMISALGACSLERCLQSGKEIHCHVLRCGFQVDIMVQTSLMDMYSKCSRMDYAERLFDRMFPKNVVA